MGHDGEEGSSRGRRGAMGRPRAVEGLGDMGRRSGLMGRWKKEPRGVVWGVEEVDGIKSSGDAPLKSPRRSVECAER